MGWLNTILDVATLGVSISNAAKLEEMRRHGATAVVMQAVLQALREQIFRYNETAKDILTVAPQSPKLAAGALRLLEARLDASSLTSELFPDLSDKEYVSNTRRFIRDNLGGLLTTLSPDEVSEVHELGNRASRLPEYTYYLDNYEKLRELNSYGNVSTIPRAISFLGTNTMGLLAFGLGVAAVCAGSLNSGGWAFVLGAAAIGVLIWAWKVNSKANDDAQARKRIEQIESEVDLELLRKVDREFMGNTSRVRQLRDEGQTLLRNYFGQSQFASLGTSSQLPATTAAQSASMSSSTYSSRSIEPMSSSVKPRVKICPKCKDENPSSRMYCANCNSKL